MGRYQRFFREFSAKSRDVVLLTFCAALLMVGAVLLSESATKDALATPLGVSQGQADYDGGYPSPSTCYCSNSASGNGTWCNNGGPGNLCYPYHTRTATLSIRTQGASTGQTVNADLNNNQSYVGSAVTAAPGQPLTIEWACQPTQTPQCAVYYGCNYGWWDNGSTCFQWTPCYGTVKISDYSIGTGFQTSGARIGSQTVTFPVNASSYTYTLQCKREGGATYTTQAAVTRGATTPSASISANPSTINSGSSSNLNWLSTEPAAQCSITP